MGWEKGEEKRKGRKKRAWGKKKSSSGAVGAANQGAKFSVN